MPDGSIMFIFDQAVIKLFGYYTKHYGQSSLIMFKCHLPTVFKTKSQITAARSVELLPADNRYSVYLYFLVFFVWPGISTPAKSQLVNEQHTPSKTVLEEQDPFLPQTHIMGKPISPPCTSIVLQSLLLHEFQDFLQLASQSNSLGPQKTINIFSLSTTSQRII